MLTGINEPIAYQEPRSATERMASETKISFQVKNTKNSGPIKDKVEFMAVTSRGPIVPPAEPSGQPIPTIGTHMSCQEAAPKIPSVGNVMSYQEAAAKIPSVGNAISYKEAAAKIPSVGNAMSYQEAAPKISSVGNAMSYQQAAPKIPNVGNAMSYQEAAPKIPNVGNTMSYQEAAQIIATVANANLFQEPAPIAKQHSEPTQQNVIDMKKMSIPTSHKSSESMQGGKVEFDPVSCSKCPVRVCEGRVNFGSITDFWAHWKDMHENQPITEYLCQFCDFKTNLTKLLLKHYTNVHHVIDQKGKMKCLEGSSMNKMGLFGPPKISPGNLVPKACAENVGIDYFDPLTCKKCPVSNCKHPQPFEKVQQFWEHWNSWHHIYMTTEIECLFCSHITTSKEQMTEHYKHEHCIFKKDEQKQYVSKSIFKDKLNVPSIHPGNLRPLKHFQDSKRDSQSTKDAGQSSHKVSAPSVYHQDTYEVDVRTLRCPVAECKRMTFDRASHFFEHWEVLHRSKILFHYFCEICSHQAKSIKDLESHYIGQHHIFKSNVRGYMESVRTKLNEELPPVVDPGKYYLPELVSNVMKNVIWIDPIECKCPLAACETVCKNAYEFQYHWVKHHTSHSSVRHETNTPGQFYLCHWCNTLFLTKPKLSDHLSKLHRLRGWAFVKHLESAVYIERTKLESVKFKPPGLFRLGQVGFSCRKETTNVACGLKMISHKGLMWFDPEKGQCPIPNCYMLKFSTDVNVLYQHWTRYHCKRDDKPINTNEKAYLCRSCNSWLDNSKELADHLQQQHHVNKKELQKEIEDSLYIFKYQEADYINPGVYRLGAVGSRGIKKPIVVAGSAKSNTEMTTTATTAMIDVDKSPSDTSSVDVGESPEDISCHVEEELESSEKNTMCLHCPVQECGNVTFAKYELLSQHWQDKHKPKKVYDYNCEACSFKALLIKNLEKHYITHHRLTENNIHNYMQSALQSAKVREEVAPEIDPGKCYLPESVSDKIWIDPLDCKCPIADCVQGIKNPQSFQFHWVKHHTKHSEMKTKNTTGKFYLCYWCNDLFESKQELFAHIKSLHHIGDGQALQTHIENSYCIDRSMIGPATYKTPGIFRLGPLGCCRRKEARWVAVFLKMKKEQGFVWFDPVRGLCPVPNCYRLRFDNTEELYQHWARYHCKWKGNPINCDENAFLCRWCNTWLDDILELEAHLQQDHKFGGRLLHQEMLDAVYTLKFEDVDYVNPGEFRLAKEKDMLQSGSELYTNTVPDSTSTKPNTSRTRHISTSPGSSARKSPITAAPAAQVKPTSTLKSQANNAVSSTPKSQAIPVLISTPSQAIPIVSSSLAGTSADVSVVQAQATTVDSTITTMQSLSTPAIPSISVVSAANLKPDEASTALVSKPPQPKLPAHLTEYMWVDPVNCCCPLIQCKQAMISSPEEMNRHWLKYHSDYNVGMGINAQNPAFLCSWCNFIRSGKEKLKTHLEVIHKFTGDALDVHMDNAVICDNIHGGVYIDPGKYRLGANGCGNLSCIEKIPGFPSLTQPLPKSQQRPKPQSLSQTQTQSPTQIPQKQESQQQSKSRIQPLHEIDTQAPGLHPSKLQPPLPPVLQTCENKLTWLDQLTNACPIESCSKSTYITDFRHHWIAFHSKRNYGLTFTNKAYLCHQCNILINSIAGLAHHFVLTHKMVGDQLEWHMVNSAYANRLENVQLRDPGQFRLKMSSRAVVVLNRQYQHAKTEALKGQSKTPVHTEETTRKESKGFHCDACEWEFESHSAVNRHLGFSDMCVEKLFGLQEARKSESSKPTSTSVRDSFKCPVPACKVRSFPMYRNLKKHWVKAHRPRKIYNCSVKRCDIKFDNEEEAHRHLNMVHNMKTAELKSFLSAIKISESFIVRDYDPGRMKLPDEITALNLPTSVGQQRVEVDIEACKCPVEACKGESFLTPAELQLHWCVTHQKKQIYLCPDCPQYTVSVESEMEDHLRLQHHCEGEALQFFTSEIILNEEKIPTEFINPGKYKLRISGTDPNPTRYPKRKFTSYVDKRAYTACPVTSCGSKHFDAPHAFEEHWKLIHVEQLATRYTCYKCPRRFDSQESLVTHYGLDEKLVGGELLEAMGRIRPNMVQTNWRYVSPGNFCMKGINTRKLPADKLLTAINKQVVTEPVLIVIRGLPAAGKSQLAAAIQVSCFFS